MSVYTIGTTLCCFIVTDKKFFIYPLPFSFLNLTKSLNWTIIGYRYADFDCRYTKKTGPSIYPKALSFYCLYYFFNFTVIISNGLNVSEIFPSVTGISVSSFSSISQIYALFTGKPIVSVTSVRLLKHS